MMCWRCGHKKEVHRDANIRPNAQRSGCSTCYNWKVNKINTFWDHEFESNLEFLERKYEQNH